MNCQISTQHRSALSDSPPQCTFRPSDFTQHRNALFNFLNQGSPQAASYEPVHIHVTICKGCLRELCPQEERSTAAPIHPSLSSQTAPLAVGSPQHSRLPRAKSSGANSAMRSTTARAICGMVDTPHCKTTWKHIGVATTDVESARRQVAQRTTRGSEISTDWILGPRVEVMDCMMATVMVDSVPDRSMGRTICCRRSVAHSLGRSKPRKERQQPCAADTAPMQRMPEPTQPTSLQWDGASDIWWLKLSPLLLSHPATRDLFHCLWPAILESCQHVGPMGDRLTISVRHNRSSATLHLDGDCWSALS
eukprot:3794255-Amphidinium_carterae.3